MTTSITFRAGWRDGLAHACPTGWATALCGASCRLPVTTGTPCRRCWDLATERGAVEGES